MSFSNKVLVGLASGIFVGLLLGERAGALSWAADGFVKLLQMTVLPYVTVSIVSSLGSLRYEDAKVLGLRTGAVLAGLWALALVFAFLVPLAFPRVESASFFSTTLVEAHEPFDFVNLFIPSNPFRSLADNIVPAVVLFSVILGLALIGVERKAALLDVLDVLGRSISRATRLIARLTPYGIFAIAADAAGTLSFEQVQRLQVYLLVYVLVALLFSLWVLPGLVAALTPIRVRDILRRTQDALITAFIAGDLFIVLPALIEASKALIARHHPATSHATDLPDVIVPASFNFPHTAKLLSLSFILFAGWFADVNLPVTEYPRLAAAGLVTFFGSLNVAVPFLLDLFRIPADTFQLFLASGVVNARFGALVAAVHTVTVALLGTCAITGALVFRPARVLRYVVVTVALSALVIGGSRVVLAGLTHQAYDKDKLIGRMRLLYEPVAAVVHRDPPAAAPVPEHASQVGLIRQRGTLRVGYTSNALPFAYFNDAGDLVGFDVDLAHRLAKDLGVAVEFVPAERPRLPELLAADACDIVMSGVVVTPEGASEMLFSSAYLDETLAFVVPDHLREKFITWEGLRAEPSLAVGVPAVPYYVAKIRELLPDARVEEVPDMPAFFRGGGASVEAVVLPAERGSVWTLMYPQFTVVVPTPVTVKIPLAYPIDRRDQVFASFVNAWVDLKRKDGTVDALYRYWILGRHATRAVPRWSILRDVLHWVD